MAPEDVCICSTLRMFISRTCTLICGMQIAGAQILIYNSGEESPAEVQPSEGALCRGGGGERPLSGWFLPMLSISLTTLANTACDN